ncbi:lethal(2) giant larvae protein isoform X2 [Coccinella septempunctata]|uniref:lethal(2) giant larvae protein isoform X2 n=1 Tax=Coccinella septempunctata TaxID=41139 RepID=UPI001D06C364|nr:lethal(2) giant larvae protein isoform X2 [Coccinella septempunctata]
MFKFIKGKTPHQSNTERQKLQKELFSYSRTAQHGFPHKPTAMAWDPSLRLLALGTATGAIKVFGQPGVEFYGQHQNPTAVTRLIFLPAQGRVVSLCDNNSLHLWEINNALTEVKFQSLEGKLKKISTMCVESSKKHLLLGTEGGNIYLLDLATFTMTPDIIYQDVVMQNVPEDYKLNPGAVECIEEQPGKPDNILIGYNRGLMILWDKSKNTAIKSFIVSQQLESVCWSDDGETFYSSHNDGSHMKWNIEETVKPEPNTPYGPFPCRSAPKILVKEQNDTPLVVFSGGLPRATYSDKYTVTVIHGDDHHVCFDFTSKVIDFIIIDSKPQKAEGSNENLVNGETSSVKGEPEALIVLAEEELVAIDLECKEWKMMSLPYLVTLHASAITCSQYVSGVPEELWNLLKDAGRAQTSHLYSNKPWPIDGGDLLHPKENDRPRRELLLTGHEDGTVRFWNAGGVTLTPIYKFSSSQFFVGDVFDEVSPDAEDMEEEWPPFRKTGIFDPYSDDPRLAVKKIDMCPLSGTLVVAGTAGQVLISKFDTEVLEGSVKAVTMNIVSDRDGFVWKGHSQLTAKTEEVRQSRGFQCTSLLQLHPPAAVTCCVLQADWGLVAAGTAHGVALFDYVRREAVMVKCTLNPNDLTGAGDAPISRRKSFKKSLRESFRRLRKGRSQRRSNNPQGNTAASPTSPPARKLPPSEDFVETKPVERQIEARPADEPMGSFVRCLYFARTFLINSQNTNPTLWAGTHNGTVYAFTIAVPNSGLRDSQAVICQLAKEIQLKHRAPVIAVAVLDGSNKPLPEPLEVEKGVSPLPDTTQAHRVIIASEEQFKIFTLPNLKPYCKYKLTAHEGARIRRMNFATFHGNHPEYKDYSEIDLLCLTNIGECLILTIPDLKRQLTAATIRREDINGISSLIFTKNAEALFFHSSSELQRLSLSTTFSTHARCFLKIPKGARDEAATDRAATTENEEPQTAAENLDLEEAVVVNGNAETKNNSITDNKTK